MESDLNLHKILSAAAQNLLFPSEIDAPFEINIWDKTQGLGISSASVMELTGNKLAEYIKETNLETLFSTPTKEQDWHSPEDKEKVKRFIGLQKIINENLKEVKVFKFGKINILVYIVGRTPQGNIMCVSTKQLQT
jgi:hypothetical protein